MKKFAAVLSVLLVATLVASPARAFPDERSEAVWAEAMNALHMRYPEEFDAVALTNAAIRGMAEKIGQPDLLAPVSPATSYYDWFNSQREIAQKVSGMSRLELEFAAVEAMLNSLDDSHTRFIPPHIAAEIQKRFFGSGEYVGIGVYLNYRDNRVYVWDVLPGSPAEKAGLRRFDRILKVDGAVVDGLNAEAAEKATQRIRGAQGSPVTLTILRPGRTGEFAVTIARDLIVPEYVSARMLDGRIGYIRFRSFERDSGKAFESAVRRLRAEGMAALVIDARANTGGLVEELRKALSALLPAGTPFIRAAYRRHSEIIVTAGAPVLDPGIPVVVLADERSASGAELMAAAISEYGRGIVVGSKTAGAVEMSVYAPLPGGAMMSVTIARVRTGKGARLEKTGVMPGIDALLSLADIDSGRDVQMERAVKEALRLIGP